MMKGGEHEVKLNLDFPMKKIGVFGQAFIMSIAVMIVMVPSKAEASGGISTPTNVLQHSENSENTSELADTQLSIDIPVAEVSTPELEVESSGESVSSEINVKASNTAITTPVLEIETTNKELQVKAPSVNIEDIGLPVETPIVDGELPKVVEEILNVKVETPILEVNTPEAGNESSDEVPKDDSETKKSIIVETRTNSAIIATDKKLGIKSKSTKPKRSSPSTFPENRGAWVLYTIPNHAGSGVSGNAGSFQGSPSYGYSGWSTLVDKQASYKNTSLTYRYRSDTLLGADQWSQPPPGQPPQNLSSLKTNVNK